MDAQRPGPPPPYGPQFGSPPYGPPPQFSPDTPPVEPASTASFVMAFVLSFASLFCCSIFFVLPLIFAIVAVVQHGNGQHASARLWVKVSLIVGGSMVAIGGLFIICYIAFMVIAGAGGSY